MVCPYLGYRTHDESHDFDRPRAYCGVAEEFVSPMYADVCNDRDRFEHAQYCDIYQRAMATEVEPEQAND